MIQGKGETGMVGVGANTLIYNDEVLESLATMILAGNKPSAKTVETLPMLKEMLFDYDIYTLSFLSDEDVEELYKTIMENGLKPTDKKLKDKLFAIRDNARVFMAIAERHNSVRAFIDGICAGGDGLATLTAEFTGDGRDYRLRLVGPVTCKKFLTQF
jgi:3-methyladenine DNA glycosylase Tag